jgi:hypothetical protein
MGGLICNGQDSERAGGACRWTPWLCETEEYTTVKFHSLRPESDLRLHPRNQINHPLTITIKGVIYPTLVPLMLKSFAKRKFVQVSTLNIVILSITLP